MAEFDKQSSDRGKNSSLREIAAAFGDIDDGELAEHPKGIWNEDAQLSQVWTADFSQMSVSECNDLANGTSIQNDEKINELPTSEIHSISSANFSSLTFNGRPAECPLLPTPNLKSSPFQLHDQQYINRLGKTI